MIVFGAPRRYVQGPGVLSRIGQELAVIGKSAVLIADSRVLEICGATIRDSAAAEGVGLTIIPFGGEITYDEIARIVARIGSDRPQVVIGAGGGKTIDTGKIVARDTGAAFVSVPTVASNDSPTSHIAVVYDADHKLVGVEENKGNPELVLVDTDVIIKAPLELLSAGVGDALVKVFEVEQCIGAGGENVFGAASPRTALALARACYDTVRENLTEAYKAHAAGTPNAAFEALVEASVLMSGLAFESGGLSVSHGMTRGLSAVPGVANALHGHQVAYGLLVQLELENRDASFMDDMRAFYRDAQLPLKLSQLGADQASNSVVQTIADVSAEAAHMKKFNRAIGASDIAAAIERIEAA
ncbi:glycerol dehydrogenase [Paracoccus thiocyanatus]|uniref:Glycerol dehydrogenase n=1 Tax=Paracoccus thiocyanatus TaxID=34006 RepID=A0A3D8PAG5_9RHOB|nr:glycerol dehydrogenase [Paracoccus thiocyanatus]RDW12622.1 glycerol dehydrogenase [Paracoccus thiocyanatus]